MLILAVVSLLSQLAVDKSKPLAPFTRVTFGMEQTTPDNRTDMQIISNDALEKIKAPAEAMFREQHIILVDPKAPQEEPPKDLSPSQRFQYIWDKTQQTLIVVLEIHSIATEDNETHAGAIVLKAVTSVPHPLDHAQSLIATVWESSQSYIGGRTGAKRVALQGVLDVLLEFLADWKKSHKQS